MSKIKTHLKLAGFSRYYFTPDGKLFSAALDKELATEKTKWGKIRDYYRPINDEGKRQVVYLDEIPDMIKAHIKAQKKVPAKKLPKGFSDADRKEYPKGKLKIEDARAIRKAFSEGNTPEALADAYNRSVSTIKQILSHQILPE